MGQAERISVEMPPETATALREAVTSGEYASEDEVVREALGAWRRQREQLGLTDEELRRLWDEGIASGNSMDGEAFFAELRAWLDAEYPIGTEADPAGRRA